MAESQKQTAAAGSTIAASDFDALLNKEFKPKTTTAKTAVQQAVRTLAEQALAGVRLVPDNVIATIEGIIAELDRKISEQVNQILHHEDFTKLEGSWRGLHYLVNNVETDEMLKIKVFNISKNDIAKTLKRYKGTAFDQSPLFKQIYEQEFGTPGGQPYGMLMGDYHFDHSAPDVEILSGMSEIAAAAHAPFITGANPTLMQMDSWQELGNPRDLSKLFQSAEYAPWRALRESDNARYLGLAMPRTLARLPYGQKTAPVEEFAFEEDTTGNDHNKYVWANAAYAMTRNIARSFKLHGWCARIRGAESGGMIENLPCHTFPTDDGGVDMKCPTEIAITDRREAELAKNGLMPLSHWKNTNYAVFIGAQSLQASAKYDSADATANAALAARLPYLFSTCRFAHYLKCMVRDKIGSFKSRKNMEDWLNNWIVQFVTSDPAASEETKAEKPLAEARVEVEEVAGSPGYYTSKFYLKPHFQLEGLTVSLRLVSKLPAPKAT